MITSSPTGTCRYHSQTKKLVITTIKKQGRRRIKKTTVYDVMDLHPDKSVANPAYRLTKPDGECYDVALEPFGITCSCAHAIYRGHANAKVPCKHSIAMVKVGFFPTEKT